MPNLWKAVYMTSKGPIQLCKEHYPTDKSELKRLKSNEDFQKNISYLFNEKHQS